MQKMISLSLSLLRARRVHVAFLPFLLSRFLPLRARLRHLLAVAAGAAEGSAQGGVLVGEVEDVLGEGGALYDAADFDGAFFLDEFADCVEEGGGELCWLVYGGM